MTSARPASGARARTERSSWTFDPETGDYREDGRRVSDERLRSALARYLDHQAERARGATADLAAGYSTVTEWELAMRKIVKETHGGAYMLGRGGRNAMTPADWGSVGRAVRDQYQRLNEFSRSVANGELSAEQATTRAALYVGAAQARYHKGVEKRLDWPSLPAYPGDGSTACLGNCGCAWDVELTDEGYEATWRLGKKDNCDDCLQRSKEWAPLVLPSTA